MIPCRVSLIRSAGTLSLSGTRIVELGDPLVPIAFTTLLSAKGLAAASAALLAVGGGSAVLASQGKASEHPPSVQTPLVSPSASPSAVSLNPLGQPSLSFLPGTHGLAVTSAVASCAAALSTGEHAIGPPGELTAPRAASHLRGQRLRRWPRSIGAPRLTVP